MNNRHAVMSSSLLAGILMLAPHAWAQRTDNPVAPTPGNRYSDRFRSADWNQQKEVLERTLKLGQSKDQYRRELEKLGWTITAVNYDKPDYVEWEIVKGDQTYEVQVDLDNGNRASKIDITTNLWRADATTRAMRGERVAAMGRGDARYSDRDRRPEYTRNEEQLERALQAGQDKAAYRRALESMGWSITSVNAERPEYTEWEIVKGDQSYEVQMDFEQNNSKARKVDVTANMWQAEATERALEGRERRSDASAAAHGTQLVHMNAADTRRLQKRLNDLGYHAGQVDGVWGPQSQAALRNFQQAKQLTVTGRLDESTKKALDLN